MSFICFGLLSRRTTDRFRYNERYVDNSHVSLSFTRLRSSSLLDFSHSSTVVLSCHAGENRHHTDCPSRWISRHRFKNRLGFDSDFRTINRFASCTKPRFTIHRLVSAWSHSNSRLLYPISRHPRDPTCLSQALVQWSQYLYFTMNCTVWSSILKQYQILTSELKSLTKLIHVSLNRTNCTVKNSADNCYYHNNRFRVRTLTNIMMLIRTVIPVNREKF